MKISASILACQLSNLQSIVPKLDKNYIDFIHLDIMDGNFVPQISFGEALCKEVKKLTEIPLDIHLMVQNPQNYIEKFFPLEPYCITFHREVDHFPIRLSTLIRQRNIKTGIAINPATNIETLKSILEYIDLILIMTVEPGFYGQKFINSSFEKIESIKKMIQGYPIKLEIDGGINHTNFNKLSKNIDIAVVGSYLFSEENPNEKAILLKTLSK